MHRLVQKHYNPDDHIKLDSRNRDYRSVMSVAMPGGSSAVAARSAESAAERAALLGAAGAAGAAATVSARLQATEAQPERAFSQEDDPSLSVTQHMACGAVAGLTEHLVMYPVDTIKTRMQSYAGVRDYANRGVFSAARSIGMNEGLGAFWRGAGAVALSAGPAHAIYFAAYEGMKESLEKYQVPLAPSVAGALATVLLDGLMTPMDVVKQRMQLATDATRYPTVLSCVKNVYSTQGASAFFAGYRATLIMNVPFTAVYMGTYDFAKRLLLSRNKNEQKFSAGSHCLAGAAAGGSAAAVTNPLDVVKTRLQTQGEVGARRYRGLTDALSAIYVEEGFAGLMRGVRARIMFQAPAAAVCWTTYEFCKHFMKVDSI